MLEWLLQKKEREGCEVDARLLMMAVGYHNACIDIDTETRREGEEKLAAPSAGRTDDRNQRENRNERENQGSDDDAMIEKRMSSRTNVKHVQTQKKIGPRELVAWGVAAVMTLASIMR